MADEVAGSFVLRLDDVRHVASGLSRPECVLATASRALFTSDAKLGIARILPDGSVTQAVDDSLIRQGFLPNGFALCADGSFLFANLGEAGGYWHAYADAPPTPFVTEIDGVPVPSANFVLAEASGRVWLTVSAASRHHDYFTDDCRQGYVALVDQGRPRIVADGVNWTNEVRVSPDGRYLYVNETFSCRTTRFDIAANGDLSNPYHFDYPPGTFPDGMAFDAEGALWLICVVTNRLIRLDPSGSFQIALEDFDEAHFERVRTADARFTG
jgi:sugar lactone lactonase YvrE